MRLTFSRGDEEQGLDLARVTAFASGYRDVLPLGDRQALHAARRLWWERACDFWQLNGITSRATSPAITCSARPASCCGGGPGTRPTSRPH